MFETEYKFIAMIPARLGSKRIPRKNLRFLIDKPLIQYPIDLCRESGLFQEIWVNTESSELGKFAIARGVKWYERPSLLAGDKATNREFMFDFLKKHMCDYVVMVNTTSPLLRAETLAGFIRYIKENDYETVMSVVSEKAETFFREEPLNFSLAEKVNSQLLEPVEKIVWALTAWKRETFLSLEENGKNPVFGGRLGKYIIPKDEACDLDTEQDWNIAEGILLSRREKREEKYL